jgi:hypothetical protein
MIEKKINHYLLSFILLFNWSIVRENFELDYILLTKILLSLVIPILGIIIMFLIKRKNNYFLNNFILSTFFYFFIDQNILPLKLSIFERISLDFFFFLIFIFILIFISFYFQLLKNFFYIFAIFFTIIQLLSGIYYYVERNYIVTNINNSNEENLFVNKSNKKGLIIFFLDEMDGVDEIAKRDVYSQNVASNVYKILNKYNFQYGENIYSSYKDTKMVHAGILNNLDPVIFNKSADFEGLFKRRYEYVSLRKNLLFDSWNGNINVYQSEHINFCAHNKVTICITDKSTNLRDLIYHLYKAKSLIALLFAKTIYFTDSIFLSSNKSLFIKYQRAQDKINFAKNLNDIFNKIKFAKDSTHNTLFFYHAMTPHVPYSFKKDCTHDYINQVKMSINERETQHALEIDCVFKSINSFLKGLENENLLDKYDIMILADHGSRISESIKHSFQTFFAVKTENIIDKNILNNNTIQNIFPKIINPNYKTLFNKIIIFNILDGISTPIPF